MTTTTTSGAADLRATFSEMLVDLPNTEPYTLFQAGFDAALAAGQATAAQQEAIYAATPTSSYAGRVSEEGFLIGTCPLYTADKMRAFADATYALRASHGQAPASVLHLVHSAFAEIAMAFPKAFALHKVGIADTAVREALAAPAPAAVAEPVAWLSPWRADQVTTDYDAYGERGIPLVRQHPQPVEREPLTDAQIKGLIEEGVFFGNCKEIVRAIEAAHGIKKGGQHVGKVD